ncbi:hypothetical protein Tco_0774623 [Tanacetum coccineum]|uniref:Uncharacterized protein n=1 Tax=Tanacetum coccineum TaxID=301880 RepID=A0ABQ4ZS59_9ASTR
MLRNGEKVQRSRPASDTYRNITSLPIPSWRNPHTMKEQAAVKKTLQNLNEFKLMRMELFFIREENSQDAKPTCSTRELLQCSFEISPFLQPIQGFEEKPPSANTSEKGKDEGAM